MSKSKTNIDKCNDLKSKFQEGNRSNNFGNILVRMHVQGFRCHTNTIIEIESPITAFCGLNGVGKSTLIQLAATAYIGQSQQDTYYLSSFINSHKFDPHPFTTHAKVEYNYYQENSVSKQLTISRKQEGGWQGYNRRLKRKVLYIGVSSYLPKVETSDFTTRYPAEIELVSSISVEQHIKEWTCKILGKNYENIETHTFKLRKRTEKINSVQHNQVNYSEPHMGYGEARSQYLIRVIESLPEKSLILIEEPEISLHPSAQYQLGCYLVDVTLRKGHQIFLTTHSEPLLSALPSQSRKYLEKTQNGIRCLDGLPPSQAHSLMSDGYSKALVIFVEDEKTKSTAKAILAEIIRRIDPNFLSTVGIYPAGDCNTVKNTVKALNDTKIKVAGVLDADQQAIPKQNIFTLPGKLAPEKELFNNQQVKTHIQKEYQLNLDDFQYSCLVDINHHQWFEKLAQKLSIEEIGLVTELSRVYVQSLPEIDISSLVYQLKEAC
ncbi:ATP-dependent nuclease [Nostoc sp. PA-18-2419]|uniref:ATP-dependent nuclease n=1 Tax=Nostoc sp. PA-18-2419 TaxID=2575443 RepID=UPI0011097E82|nr:AAA family ATPase [Nostoc sp. PA-18-2419]